MLIQMNNASLLEAYATLGIEPAAEDIEERKLPKNFNLSQGFKPHTIGTKAASEHPGDLYGNGPDPIKELEEATHGKADNILTLAAKISARFETMSGEGADFAAFIDNALAMAKLPGTDFDPSVLGVGAEMFGKSAEHSCVRSDPAGQSPFSGFRADYRPETAPDGCEVVRRRHLPFSPEISPFFKLGGE